MRNFLLALNFLTRLPFKFYGSIHEQDLAHSMLYFPVVGLLIGLLLLGIDISCSRFLPPVVVTAVILITLIGLTGALHLDGFADTVDGLYGGNNPQEVLRIMKDPHIGAIGVVALVCLLLFKFSVLLSLRGNDLYLSLITMPVLGRWSMVVAACSASYARATGIGAPFVKNVRAREWIGASLITVAICMGLMRIRGLLLCIGGIVSTLLFAQFIKKRIGGMTGDTLGATGEIIEALSLAMVLATSSFKL